MRRPLAKDVNAVVNRHLDGCRNLGLILDKYQPYQPVPERVNRGGWDLFMNGTHDNSKGSAARGAWFTGRVARGEIQDPALEPNSRLQKEVLKPFLARWESGVKAAGAKLFVMWTESPLIIGLGAKGTLETALTLHPLYGFPYAPGSALKGVARAAAFFDLAAKLGIEGVDNAEFLRLKNRNEKTQLQELARTLDEDERWEKDVATWPERYRPHAAELRQFRLLFGWRGRAGGALFFDGVPARVPRVAGEVMTPHFKDYYNGVDAPHDADSPNPISLLAVASGVPFGFAVGWRHSVVDEALREQAMNWLGVGLEELGLGGKTAAGYGFFAADKPRPARSPKARREPDLTSYQRPKTTAQSHRADTHPTPKTPPPHKPNKGEDFMAQWQEKRRREGDE